MTSMKQMDADTTSLAEAHETQNSRRRRRGRRNSKLKLVANIPRLEVRMTQQDDQQNEISNHDKTDIDMVKCEDSGFKSNPLIDKYKAKREDSPNEISKAKITNKTHRPSSSKTKPDLTTNKVSCETPTDASIASIKKSTRSQEENLKSGAVNTASSNAEVRQSSKKLPSSTGGSKKSKKKEEGRMNVKQYQQSPWQQEVRLLVDYNRQQHGITGMPLHHYNTTASTQYVESYGPYHSFLPFEQRRPLDSQTMELRYRQPQYGRYQSIYIYTCY